MDLLCEVLEGRLGGTGRGWGQGCFSQRRKKLLTGSSYPTMGWGPWEEEEYLRPSVWKAFLPGKEAGRCSQMRLAHSSQTLLVLGSHALP